MRYLAIDPGEKRIGLAAGDDETGVITPAGVIELPPGRTLAEAIARATDEHAPDAVVIGLPLNMDGTEGPQAARARELGRQVAALTGRPVHYQDERLTSFAAEKRLDRSGRTHKAKKALRDALAAAEILRDFLNDRAR